MQNCSDTQSKELGNIRSEDTDNPHHSLCNPAGLYEVSLSDIATNTGYSPLLGEDYLLMCNKNPNKILLLR